MTLCSRSLGHGSPWTDLLQPESQKSFEVVEGVVGILRRSEEVEANVFFSGMKTVRRAARSQ